MPFFARILALAGAALFIAGSAEAESLSLTIGELRREPAQGTIANVVVADPAIADVTVIDQHSVVIMAKGFGTTGILATDRAGHVLIDDQVIIGAPQGEGHITLYRGVTPSNYACMPFCHALDGAGGAGGAFAPSAAPAGPSSGGSGYAAPAQAVTTTITASQTTAPLHP
jgi:hypothetical protein